MASSLHDFQVRTITGDVLDLSQYTGKVVLVVNTASACGFTPQLSGLQDLYQRFADDGLVILGFPCNQFGHQDPGANEEIAQFCQKNYGVDFPMMAKVDVNGDHAEPLFVWLKEEAPGLLGSKAIKWNFTKFLVGRDGQVIRRYPPQEAPVTMTEDIAKALSATVT